MQSEPPPPAHPSRLLASSVAPAMQAQLLSHLQPPLQTGTLQWEQGPRNPARSWTEPSSLWVVLNATASPTATEDTSSVCCAQTGTLQWEQGPRNPARSWTGPSSLWVVLNATASPTATEDTSSVCCA
eukprot:CAMPEP_0177564924 /NCGR_PEP_ID=MMETSP0369-20130122/73875_1 /TAXON_ID=447022 ORGANISM="Scrippsiella hangoei-like, Strain SHHI-4" /NCGR_SAMPLE_ID=MMETSP0369 /ASSEMBLY_ACC=CAM_ASM_000364 /LENGTH=127 /DNA_ID=CAMNT_0019052245 /DNA_START=1060 /DNA_END=1439 /DNA_ORIENTATION=+